MNNRLHLRHAAQADKDALAAFNVAVHAHPHTSSAYLDRYMRDLFEHPHPLIAVEDHLVIEGTATGVIVSSVQLIRQTWTYSGHPVPVGQIELVGTAPAYRRQGLVRNLIDAAHSLSAERGDLMTLIGGKANFYRQFGYEYALDLGGGRYLPHADLPKHLPNARKEFHLRPAKLDDASWLAELDAIAAQRYRVACPRDAALWRYEIAGRSPDNIFHYHIHVLEHHAGAPAGYVVYVPSTRSPRLRVIACEVWPDHSWLLVAPVILCDLDAIGAAHPWGDGAAFAGLYLGLGSRHPLYDAAGHMLIDSPDAYCVRLPDIAAFVRHVAPILEQRLVHTAAQGYSGDLRLSWYRGGLHLHFTEGRLQAVTDWSPDDHVPGDAAFPGLTLLPLIFGFRSLAELQHAYPDCQTHSATARVLLDALFPGQASRIWSVV
jgi:ribosomal protein S18 acetylase RimI-like enzyme